MPLKEYYLMVILMGFQKTTEINVYVKPDSFGLYFKA
jgi:hypothetical protein